MAGRGGSAKRLRSRTLVAQTRESRCQTSEPEFWDNTIEMIRMKNLQMTASPSHRTYKYMKDAKYFIDERHCQLLRDGKQQASDSLLVYSYNGHA